MPRDIAPSTARVAKDGPALTGSQGGGHELALLYGGRCPLAPGNDNLGAWVAAAEL
jgi:hypothetical protein